MTYMRSVSGCSNTTREDPGTCPTVSFDHFQRGGGAYEATGRTCCATIRRVLWLGQNQPSSPRAHPVCPTLLDRPTTVESRLRMTEVLYWTVRRTSGERALHAHSGAVHHRNRCVDRSRSYRIRGHADCPSGENFRLALAPSDLLKPNSVREWANEIVIASFRVSLPSS